MAENTGISWAHSTFNPWIGCTKVGPGCDNCYAATLMQDRHKRVTWGAGEARSRTKTWDQPLRWNKQAAASGEPWRVFCASLADVFDNEVPDEWRTDLWALIAATPHLTWLILTKRIGLAPRAMPANVWIGATMVNQDEYVRDIDKLLRIDAPVRFISAEPLLGQINLIRSKAPEWLIVGGESGANARPMNPDWVGGLRDQCAELGVAFHFKQWGGRSPKANGHTLDGVDHRAFPK